MAETVIIDLGEVCMTGMIGAEIEISRGLGMSAAETWSHLNYSGLADLFHGEITEDVYWEGFMRQTGSPPVIDGMPALDFLRRTMRRNFRKIDGTGRIVAAIGNAGYRLVLLSDHAREWVEYCEKEFPSLQAFPTRCYSFDSGYTKKFPESFLHALKMAGADAETTLFVDDNAGNLRVAQSREVGIKYVHRFTDPASFEKALPSYGIHL